jgi:hypothetical protein
MQGDLPEGMAMAHRSRDRRMLMLLLLGWLVASAVGVGVGYLMYSGVDKVVAGHATRAATAGNPGSSASQ